MGLTFRILTVSISFFPSTLICRVCDIYLRLYIRDRDAPGLDTVVPLETTAAYNMMDVITGVSSSALSVTYLHCVTV